MAKTLEDHADEAEGYVSTLSDRQVLGVIETERDRIRNAPEGEVADVARVMLRAARSEARVRGISED